MGQLQPTGLVRAAPVAPDLDHFRNMPLPHVQTDHGPPLGRVLIFTSFQIPPAGGNRPQAGPPRTFRTFGATDMKNPAGGTGGTLGRDP